YSDRHGGIPYASPERDGLLPLHVGRYQYGPRALDAQMVCRVTGELELDHLTRRENLGRAQRRVEADLGVGSDGCDAYYQWYVVLEVCIYRQGDQVVAAQGVFRQHG